MNTSLTERLALTVASALAVAALASFWVSTVAPYFQAIGSAITVVR